MHSLSPASRTHRAAAIVNWLTSRWKSGPVVRIAPTARHLPFPAPDDARGLHWNGTVHLVANQAPDSLAQTLAHEAVGHYGLRAMLGKEWPHFMRHIQLGLQAGDPGLRTLQRHIRAAYVDEAGRFCLSPRQEADEIAAYAAEELLCLQSGRIRPGRPLAQAIEAWKGRALREGLLLERGVSRQELEGALLLAAQRMEGGPLGPVRRWIGRRQMRSATIALMRDLNKPPMSLEESERLLKAEEDRLHRKGETKGFLAGIGLIVSFPLLLACIGIMIWGLISLFAR
ncbi:hypothetical protein IB269_16375 [Delftia sp. DLF01]|uniref:hypothetical protein n=1 Tax=Delftia sp. DLF01 TaxID=2769279 RepID=UPI0017802DE1|nr:hypothetical protein [Delftia sp. DLF01]MBD9582969.1 hypothetical protein [Delftia sp. DLF01]